MTLDLTTVTAGAGLVFGLIGTALGVWSRVDRILDKRENERATRPRMIVEATGQSNGWTALTIRFMPSGMEGFWIQDIRVDRKESALTTSIYAPSERSEVVVLVGGIAMPDEVGAASSLPVGVMCGPIGTNASQFECWLRTTASSAQITAVCVRTTSTNSAKALKRREVSIAAIVPMTSTAK
ncbi:hypothetical protein [Pleomorphomonas sp. T1.2MG-36]|uniref:hypothetical protein n=1 Tax=Pleomorphomonas sp. T1.2MG-36 TaxID=3041167 RepID=UPI0025407258|nr:hypothetical protein [Pleomorphomonas sp. T1.2MG-36]